MAQTYCLQCSGSFDDSARFCPGCGYPVPAQPVCESPAEPDSKPAKIEAGSQSAESSLSLTNSNSLILAFCVFAGMVTIGLGMGGSESSSRSASFDDGKSWAITMAQAFVKERIEVPIVCIIPLVLR